MKKLALILAVSALSSTAFAGPGKTSILHCGVDAGEVDMTYKAISISKKSRGHGKNHVVGSIDSVPTGTFDELTEEEIYVDYVRAGADCLLEGQAGDLGLALCDATTQYEGAICGMQAL